MSAMHPAKQAKSGGKNAGFFGFFKDIFKKTTITPLDTPDKIFNALTNFFGYQTKSGTNVSDITALQMTTVFACIRVLSESLGMLPCKLYKQTKDKIELAVDHPVYYLLNVQPNDYMTAQEFWEMLMVCLCLRGNFYCYKNTLGGEVRELLPLNPACVTPKINSNFEVTYKVDFGNGRTETLTQDEIWHVRGITLDGLNGLSPISYARHCIGLGLSLEEHGSKLFANGAVTNGVLQTEQELTEPAYNRLKEDFTGNHVGLENAYKPMILEMGLEWKPISLNAEDSQFLETRRYTREEICAIFRVSPTLVQILDKASLNNTEALGAQFLNYSLMPHLTRVEARIKVGLLKKSERTTMHAKFNAGALLRGDLITRYQSYATAINWGILNPNECRESEDRNPREGGDIYLTPTNMTTIPGNPNADKKPA